MPLGMWWCSSWTVSDGTPEDPTRLQKAIPPHLLGLGAQERKQLETALGRSINAKEGSDAEEYVQSILPTLLDLVAGSGATNRPPLTAKSRVWDWVGITPPSKDSQVSAVQSTQRAMDAVAGLLRKLGTIEGRQEVVGFVLGQQLRHQYGLGKGRGHKIVPFEDEMVTPPGIEAYPNVEAQVDAQAMLDSLPPKQREALMIYVECELTGRTVLELAEERGLNPVNVRNNVKAFRNKHRH